MPSSRGLRTAVLDALSAVPAGSTVVDIGSGWGGLTRRVAGARPDLSVVGFERSVVPYLWSILVSRVARHDNLSVMFSDFREVGPRSGTCYLTYLSPDGMKWVRSLFEAELPRDVRLVSCVFAVRGWTPERTLRAPDLHRSRVFVYRLQP
jgi:hypothetical protein